jgi:hypothetical protein
MTKRLISTLLALTLALSMLIPCAVAEDSGKMLRIIEKADPETLDVQLTTDSYCIPLNCFDRLVEIDTVDGLPQIVPGLADSWEMTEEVEVLAYVLVTGFHDTNCIPVSWTLYAGDSYSLLEPIDVQEKAIMPSTTRTHSQVFTIDPDNVGYYQYYRLVFTGNATGSPGYLATSPGYEASELILLAAEE